MQSSVAGDRAAARNEWRQNWPIVVAAGGGSAMSTAHVFALGVMTAPLEEAFDWSRTQITSGLTLASFVTVCFAPFMGMAIDRFGPRRIVLFGLCLYCAAVGALSLTTASIWAWWGLWLFLAYAHLHIKPTAWVTGVSSVFLTNRGLALGVLLSVAGLGAIVTPSLTALLMHNFGWRMAFVLLPLCWAAIVIPLVYFFFSSAKDKVRTSDIAMKADPSVAVGVALRDGFLSPVFFKLAAAAFLMVGANMAVVINLVPILRSLGHPLAVAAGIAGIVGIMQIVGRLVGGFLMDRVNARIVVGIAAMLPAVASLLILTFPGSMVATVIAVLLLGFGTGAENDGLAYLSSRYFGMRNFGALFGTVAGLVTLGLGTGPLLASVGYDIYGSYDVVLWCTIPFVLLSGLLFLTAGPYPNFEKPAER